MAREVGLLGERGVVLDASQLSKDDNELAVCLDGDDGAVVARVTPGQKLRIARVLRQRGHVVAMTGDGVNDAPALREADVGVAMGQSGSDVTKAAADLVLLDDHFATIVNAVELGRATFANVRRFLTYHLTDNVAELAPFAAWALTGGQLPLAIGVVQVLALDIGTDMLPALALGTEPPSRRIMSGRVRQRSLIVGRLLLRRALLVLGVTEAVCALTTFVAVLYSRGWTWAAIPDPSTLATKTGHEPAPRRGGCGRACATRDLPRLPVTCPPPGRLLADHTRLGPGLLRPADHRPRRCKLQGFASSLPARLILRRNRTGRGGSFRTSPGV